MKDDRIDLDVLMGFSETKPADNPDFKKYLFREEPVMSGSLLGATKVIDAIEDAKN